MASMRSLASIILVIFLGSCDWSPEQVEIYKYDAFQSLKVVTGVKTRFEIEGYDIVIDDAGDSSIVRITPNDSGFIEFTGRNEGQTNLIFSYVVSEEEEPLSSTLARITFDIEVVNGVPLSVFVEDSIGIDLHDYIDANLVNQVDSVDIRYTEGTSSINTEIVLDIDSLILAIKGVSPGREGLAITFFSETDSLVPTILFEISTTIEKKVFAEMFTNSGCVNCPEANHILDNVNEEYSRELTVVRYHVNWTDPEDPMNLYNPTDVENRRAYYNIIAAPSLVLDGSLIGSLDENDWSARIGLSAASETNIYISPVHLLESADSLFLDFELNSFGLEYHSLTCWSLVFEDSIEYAGSNGEVIHMQVMRDITSTSISSMSELIPIQHSLKKPPLYDNGRPTSLIVFVQSEVDKRIIQSRKQRLLN